MSATAPYLAAARLLADLIRQPPPLPDPSNLDALLAEHAEAVALAELLAGLSFSGTLRQAVERHGQRLAALVAQAPGGRSCDRLVWADQFSATHYSGSVLLGVVESLPDSHPARDWLIPAELLQLGEGRHCLVLGNPAAPWFERAGVLALTRKWVPVLRQQATVRRPDGVPVSVNGGPYDGR